MHPVAPALVFVTLAAGLVALLVPAWLAAAWRRRTQVPWRVFFYGMLTFFVSSAVLLWLGIRWSRWTTGAGDASTAHVA